MMWSDRFLGATRCYVDRNNSELSDATRGMCGIAAYCTVVVAERAERVRLDYLMRQSVRTTAMGRGAARAGRGFCRLVGRLLRRGNFVRASSSDKSEKAVCQMPLTSLFEKEEPG